MKNINLLLLITFSLFLFNSCEEDLGDVEGTTSLNYVSFEDTEYQFGVDVGSTSTHEIKVFTTQKTGSDRTFNIMVVEGATTTTDPAAYNVPATVTVPANSNIGTFDVTIQDLNIGVDGKTLTLAFQDKEGVFLGENMIMNVIQVCDEPVNISFTFDGYASEITWEILDSSDAVIISGGPWADGTTGASRAICLASGDYTFTVNDSYGDGLTYPTTGNINITYGDEEIIIGGDFGSSTTVNFSL